MKVSPVPQRHHTLETDQNANLAKLDLLYYSHALKRRGLFDIVENTKMPTTYEWDIETWADDEVVDHNHRDRLHDFGGEELTRAVAEDGYRLVLVRDNDNGRSWAYVTNGELPTHFLDAYDRQVAKVPARFVSEFNR